MRDASDSEEGFDCIGAGGDVATIENSFVFHFVLGRLLLDWIELLFYKFSVVLRLFITRLII